MLGPDSVNTISELLRLSKVGQLALHPDSIGVRGISDCPVDSTITTTLQTVVTFSCPRCLPVEEDILAQHSPRNLSRLFVALALGLLLVSPLRGSLVTATVCVDGGQDGVVEALEVGGGEPLILDALEFWAGLVGGGGGHHEVV